MGFLDPKPIPRVTNPGTPTAISRLLRLDPNETNVAPFDIVSKQFANGGGKPYNVGVWMGFNAERYLQDGSGETGKITWHLGMESGYHNPDDLTYGPEFYLNYGTPDNTTIKIAELRPMYFRLIEGDTNNATDKGVHTLFDIGPANTGIFAVTPGYVASGAVPAFSVTKGEIHLSSTAVVADGSSFAVRPKNGTNTAANLIVDSKGTGIAVTAQRVNGAPAASIVSTDVNTTYLADKSDNPVLVLNYGADVKARQVNLRSRLNLEGAIWAGSNTNAALTVADTGNLGAAPTISGNAVRGTVSIGTGASPAAGDAVSITIPAGVYTSAPNVVASGANFSTAGKGVYAYAVSATEIRIGFGTALLASQAAGTFKVNYQIIG